MAAKLDKVLKRELAIDGEMYTLTISPEGARITRKGHRKGPEITWKALLTGEAELAQQLRVSVDATRS